MNEQPAPDERQLVLDAARAMAQGQDDQAWSTLQQCVQMYPGSASAHHLLGALAAHLGQYDAARQHLVLALHYAPHMHEARLQLALLLLTLGQASSALDVLHASALDQAPPAIAAYSQALCSVAEGRLQDALSWVDQGLAAGHPNAALDAEMQRLRDQVARGMGDGASSEPATDHVLLQAYGAMRQ